MMCAQKLELYFYNFNRKLLLYDGFVKFFDTNKTISINSGTKKKKKKKKSKYKQYKLQKQICILERSYLCCNLANWCM